MDRETACQKIDFSGSRFTDRIHQSFVLTGSYRCVADGQAKISASHNEWLLPTF